MELQSFQTPFHAARGAAGGFDLSVRGHCRELCLGASPPFIPTPLIYLFAQLKAQQAQPGWCFCTFYPLLLLQSPAWQRMADELRAGLWQKWIFLCWCLLAGTEQLLPGLGVPRGTPRPGRAGSGWALGSGLMSSPVLGPVLDAHKSQNLCVWFLA